MGIVEYYLIVINIIGIILVIINTLLHTYTSKGQIDNLLMIVSLLGGSAGIALAILIIDRKAGKDNMMSHVFVFSVLVIQVVIVLFVKGFHKENLTIAFGEFFAEHLALTIYLIIINVITFIAFGIDKYNAVKHRSRIKIVTLLLLSFIGGALGGWAAMYIFKHKTRKNYFTVGMPLIILMQIAVVFYLMNSDMR